MPDRKPGVSDLSQQREMALSRWDNEGGAVSQGPQEVSQGPQELLGSGELESEIPQLTNAELVQLRVRVIALENLVIALLAQASDRQLDFAREMAAYISPRAGFSPHPLTTHATAHMLDLVERAGHFRAGEPS